MRLLLVDDDFSSIEALANLLEYNNTLKIANNGTDALMMFKSELFDVVVTDVKMPKMNGLELLREIRIFNKDAIVIVVTGHSTEALELEATTLGARKVFSKPLDVKKFMDILSEIEYEKNSV